MTVPDSPNPSPERRWWARWRGKLLGAMASEASPHATEPDFWRDLRDELLAGRQWVDRAVVLCYAAITGLVVVAFTLLAERASHAFAAMTGAGEFGRYLPLLWTPSLTVVVLWWTRRYAPGALGSGIPQVVRALGIVEPSINGLLNLHAHGLIIGIARRHE